MQKLDQIYSSLDLINNLFEDYHFELTIVGGLVRDTILGLETSEIDIDLELNYCCEDNKFDTNFSQAVKLLSEKFTVETCSFNVLKLVVNDLKIEIAPARVENYLQSSPFKHSDFSADFVKCTDYKKSFARRDFSVNAIGYSKKKIIDPFNGINDLNNKILRNCGSNFFYDPVRFLRLIRFEIILNFAISKEILNSMHKFDLTYLTNYYFFKEALKSKDILKFIKNYLTFCHQYQLKRPSWDKILDSIPISDEPKILTVSEFITYLVSHHKDLTYLYKFGEILGIKKKAIKQKLIKIDKIDKINKDK